MDIQEILEKYGLTDKEIKIYIETLKHDEINPTALAKLTKIPRTTVYDVMTDLSLKGLIEVVKNDVYQKQQTLIRAKNPSELRKGLRKKQHDLVDLEVDVVSILPQLKGAFFKDDANANFQFYPGVEGAKKVLFDKEQFVDVVSYSWSNLMPMDAFGREEMNELVSQLNTFRKRSKNRRKELVPLNDWTRHVLTYQYERDRDYFINKEVRFIDSAMFNIYQEMDIIGDRIAIVCAEGDEVWGLVMKSKALAMTFKSIFELSWQAGTRVTPELLEYWGPNEFLMAEKSRK